MPINDKIPTPLYLQIVDDIFEKINSNVLKRDDKLGSQIELCRYYKVSPITVKKALAELKKRGVIYSRKGRGTFVGRTQNRLSYSNTKTIGIVLRNLNNPFFSMILHAAEQKISEYNYNLLLANSSDKPEKEDQIIDRFLYLGVDGLIIASLEHEYRATATINKLHKEGFPYVMVSYVDEKHINFVGTDHEQGGYLATEYLIHLGYDTIGYINGEQNNLVGDLRMEGYQKALRDYGKKEKKNFVIRLPVGGEQTDFQCGYGLGKKILKLSSRPEAMFIYNDLAALGFMKSMMDSGLSIPDDLAIVGFDDIERSKYAPVPLTSVKQPTKLIGSIAVENVVRQIKKTDYLTRTILKPEIIVRKSCGGSNLIHTDFVSSYAMSN